MTTQNASDPPTAAGGPHIRLRLRCRSGWREAAGERVEAAAAEFFRCWPSEVTLTEEEIRRIFAQEKGLDIRPAASFAPGGNGLHADH